MKYEVKLWITKTNEEVEGLLIQANQRFPFDPLTIIGDFLEAKGENTVFPKDNHLFTRSKSNDPGMILLHESDEYINDVEKALRLSAEIRTLLLAARRAPLSAREQMEGIFNDYNVSVECERSAKDDDIDDSRISYNTRIRDLSKMDEQEYWYTYTCHSISQIIASMWHYYLEQGYQLGRCDYCGKLFARKSNKERLCSRMQPFENMLTHKIGAERTCKNAVKYMREQLSKKRNAIGELIRNSAKLLTEDEANEILLDFRNTCDSYAIAFRKTPNFENYRKYAQYLITAEQEKKWRKNPPT